MRLSHILGVAFTATFVLGGCGQASETTAVVERTQVETETTPVWVGEWLSVEDRRATLNITQDTATFLHDGTITFGYDGTVTEVQNYTIEKGCPEHPELAFVDDTIVTTTADFDFCYAIDTATEDRLVLIYLPRGIALEYQRATFSVSR